MATHLHNHPLTYYQHGQNQMWRCNICGQSYLGTHPSWTCFMCNFDACDSCHSASTGTYQTRPGITPTPAAAVDTSMYNPSIHSHRLYRNDYGNFRCDKCNQYKFGGNYACEPCNYHCCLECFNYFNR